VKGAGGEKTHARARTHTHTHTHTERGGRSLSIVECACMHARAHVCVCVCVCARARACTSMREREPHRRKTLIDGTLPRVTNTWGGRRQDGGAGDGGGSGHAALGSSGEGRHSRQRAAGLLRRQRAVAGVPRRGAAVPASPRHLHPFLLHLLPAPHHIGQALGRRKGALPLVRLSNSNSVLQPLASACLFQGSQAHAFC
jgi:hypothetical protein